MSVRPGAEPFGVDASDVGVLFCHGFTGNPTSLRPWAEHAAAAGLTVRLPRLPGHGTTWKDMAGTRWEEPLLLLRSPEDHVVPASSSALILSRISSAEREEVLLEDSYHVATLDNDAPRIFEGTVSFVNRIAQVLR